MTICLQPRFPLLISDVAEAFVAEAGKLTIEAVWTLRCLTVMPDHVHLFFTLGAKLTLSQVVARLKTKSQKFLHSQGCDWQINFYDRMIRKEDSVEDVIRYIYLNPFRAGLISLHETWPNFYCCEEDWSRFRQRD